MPYHSDQSSFGRAGFTILEVLVSALLIALAVGSIMGMHTQSMHVLHNSHLAAASSQVLQERVEMLRSKPWPDIASTVALTDLMGTATESETELAEANLTETLKVSLPADTADRAAASANSFTMTRHGGVVTPGSDYDFSQNPTLLLEGTATWRDDAGVHTRSLRTVICRDGLTRAGVFGSALGRAVPSS